MRRNGPPGHRLRVGLGGQVEVKRVILIIDRLAPVPAIPSDEQCSGRGPRGALIPLELDRLGTERGDRLGGVNFGFMPMDGRMTAIIDPPANDPDPVPVLRPGPTGQERGIPLTLNLTIVIFNVGWTV